MRGASAVTGAAGSRGKERLPLGRVQGLPSFSAQPCLPVLSKIKGGGSAGWRLGAPGAALAALGTGPRRGANVQVENE